LSNVKMPVNDHLDHQRWLIDNGFINDLHKDTLYMYGAIVHKDVQAVQVDIDVKTKLVKYHVYMDKSLIDKLRKYELLSKSSSIIGLWRFKRMLRKEGNLNLLHLLNRFVKDYCGPKWAADLVVMDFRDYKDGFEEITQRDSGGDEANQQPDQ
jgi:hypothetical protein